MINLLVAALASYGFYALLGVIGVNSWFSGAGTVLMFVVLLTLLNNRSKDKSRNFGGPPGMFNSVPVSDGPVDVLCATADVAVGYVGDVVATVGESVSE